MFTRVMKPGFTFPLAVLIVLLLLATDASAQMAEDNILGGVVGQFGTQMRAFQTSIGNLLKGTFWGLVFIEFAWTLVLSALNDEGLNGIVREIIVRIAFVGFFFWLLGYGPTLVKQIFDTMVQLGSSAGGTNFNAMSPDKVIDLGIDLMKRSATNWSVWEMGTGLGIFTATVITFVALVVVAANMALILAEFYIVGYGGIFLLALGGSRWTSGYAVAYIKYVLATCTKIFIMLVLVGVGYTVMVDYTVNSADTMTQAWALCAFGIILAILASRAPDAVTGLLSGVNTQAAITASRAMSAATSAAQGAATGGASAAGMGAAVGAAASLGSAQSTKSGMGGLAQAAGNTLGNLASSAKADMAGSLMGTKKPGGVFPGGNSGTMGGRMAANMNAQKASINKDKS
ncbi:P-type conjugative transfer protein TrbL [Maritalea sp.]|uniref:P-type conjugative transfer protein TrbL n=1 Tax=Maritalea sp. TaxID=2003361 RepID=UPI003EFA8436